jgi:hypothetical protein
MKKTFFPSNSNKFEGLNKSKNPFVASRREFIHNVGLTIAGISMLPDIAQATSMGDSSEIDVRSFLSTKLYSRKEVDDWLSGRGIQFAEYDSEVGWLLRNARWSGSVNNLLKSEGVSGATWETSFDHDKFHERHMIAYAGRPC